MRRLMTFFAQSCRHWRQTGAVAPSGPRLARVMSASVGHVQPGDVIVELGPGTGVFTRRLMRDHPGHRVVAIEMNPVFVHDLRREFPGLLVIEGSACDLVALLRTHGIDPARVGAVVSGLPLLALPRAVSNGILAAVAAVLPPGRPFIQFTYVKMAWRRLDLSAFRAVRQRKVWWNVPPATVMSFTRCTSHS